MSSSKQGRIPRTDANDLHNILGALQNELGGGNKLIWNAALYSSRGAAESAGQEASSCVHCVHRHAHYVSFRRSEQCMMHQRWPRLSLCAPCINMHPGTWARVECTNARTSRSLRHAVLCTPHVFRWLVLRPR